ncbi:hypothetical protein [Streptomyces fagopyri]|uniref:hypothetical protein n=1 Tax=Streptomyces fagopyri TaxID=2662397 RepID=UPI0033D237A9
MTTVHLGFLGEPREHESRSGEVDRGVARAHSATHLIARSGIPVTRWFLGIGRRCNALILSGEQRYRDWIAEYVGAWRERCAANGGILPDNVAPDGTVGGLLEGRWYGGHYGWSWPHGWYSVGHAAIVAALAGAAATGDDTFLDLVRPTLDEIISLGRTMPFTEADSSIRSK